MGITTPLRRKAAVRQKDKWSQPLCSAVARMFVGCVRAHGRGEASAEDSILFPPRRPAGKAGAGAYDGETSIAPFSSAILIYFKPDISG